MAITSVDEEQMLRALRSLEFAFWPDVLRYIQGLQEQPQKIETQQSVTPTSLTMSAAELANSEIVGLWQERTDIMDSSSFARQLRTDAEQQRIKRHVAS